MGREDTLRSGLSTASKVIEIGPSFNPLLPKRDGWNVFTIDHDDRAGLVAKYANDPSVDTTRIEEVDFVWHGGSLLDAIPPEHHGTFDAFVASHVIEHTPDIVTFLAAAATLIKPGGVIILAVPDKDRKSVV